MKRNILLVDDDKDILYSIKTILEYEDYNVYTAISTVQARIIFIENDIHLIIVDYIFSDCTGDQLIKVLKKIDKNFSVIFLSGWPQVIKTVEELEFEIERVFLKPIDPEILLSAINSIFTGDVDPYQSLDSRQIVNELNQTL